MATRHVSAPLSVEQLLDAVKRLPRAELSEFQHRYAAWQEENDKESADEAALVEATRTRLPPADDRRLRRLTAKSEQGTLTPKELAEYRSLALLVQKLDVTRTKALAELVRRRGKPVHVVMEEIGWEGADGP